MAIDLLCESSVETVPLLGEFELQIDLYHREDLPVEFEPEIPDGCSGQIEWLPDQPLGQGLWRRAVMRLRALEGPGELVIAPFKAVAEDGTISATTPELPIEVTSLLVDETQQQAGIEAPGPLLESRPWPWLWLGIAGVVLALLALLWWWSRRERAPSPSKPVVLQPAHIKALQEFARLRGQSRRTPGEIEAFYVDVSQVLRVYLEERFGLRAPERTTEEFLLEVEAGGPLTTSQCLDLRRFLQQCDLVKFAAQVPAEEVHLVTLAAAEVLVDATKSDAVRTLQPQVAGEVA